MNHRFNRNGPETRTTIIIPNYNGLSFLGPCLESLKQQTVHDFKVLVVDNGSTDGSVQWLREQGIPSIFLDHNTTGDGILTAIQLLSVMKRTGKKASELAKAMEVMPQVLVNARVNNAKKNTYMEVPAIRHAIAKLEEEFSADGRVLIRTSGTEPLIRVMIEGKDMERMEKAAKELAAFIEKTLQ